MPNRTLFLAIAALLTAAACSDGPDTDQTSMQIAAAAGATCVLTPGQGVSCRGMNDRGQAGAGSVTNFVESFELVPGTSDAIALGAGSKHFCAQTPSDVLCWGDNSDGAIGYTQDPSGSCSTVLSHVNEAVDVPCARRPVSLGVGSVDWIAIGDRTTCVGRTDGPTGCFGGGPNIGGNSELHTATAGGRGRCGVRSDGKLFCVDDGASLDDYGAVSEIGRIEQMAVANGNICILQPDRQLHCWGSSNERGQLATGDTEFAAAWKTSNPIPTARSVSLSGGHGCAIDEQGSVWCWGTNIDGELGTSSALVDGGTEMIDPQTDPIPSACDASGCSPDAIKVEGIDDAVRVFSLDSSSCAARSSGELWCWGEIVDTHRPTRLAIP